MKSPTELAAAFRAQGLKVTPQRQLLFTLLEDNTTHPTADVLFARASAQMPGISLRTVYTTLTDLVEMGELQTVTLGTGATRFDPNVDGSDALVIDRADQFTPPRAASIVFHGTCADCAGDRTDSSSPTTTSNKEHHHG